MSLDTQFSSRCVMSSQAMSSSAESRLAGSCSDKLCSEGLV